MTKAQIDGRKGGSIDFGAGPSRLHVTGRILSWAPPWLFEHEWKVDPSPEIPAGEDAAIRWELVPDGDGTVPNVEHNRLNYRTAVGFAPGAHSFMDRLEAQLDKHRLPNWMERHKQVASLYPSSWMPK